MECQTLSLFVESRSSNASAIGIGPYYMFAFEPGGVPTTSPVGINASSLSWQVKHRRGTSPAIVYFASKSNHIRASGAALMLTMMDSNNTIGGVSPTLYTVAGIESRLAG